MTARYQPDVRADLDVAARLTIADEDGYLRALGLNEDDRADARRAIAAALDDPAALTGIAAMTDLLRHGIGRTPQDVAAIEVRGSESSRWGVGVLPMLALLVVTEDIRQYHRARGVPDEVSDATLADLGRQAWVHRRTFGEFGLHTYSWVAVVFSGTLYRLGRLQFNLDEFEGERVLSTHIPEEGPLTPGAVRASFEAADRFFTDRFPEYVADRFHCASWLLDPQLADVLDSGSNIMRFQRLWTLRGEAEPGDEDALFFVFRRRGDVDLRALPRDTSLQRAILTHLESGGHWCLRHGVLSRSAFRIGR